MSFKTLPLIAVAIATAISAHAAWSERLSVVDHVVPIQDFIYASTPIRPRIGDTVTWVNEDIVPHTVTAEDGDWDSGEIAPGGRWSMTLAADTAAAYYCVFHPQMKAALPPLRP